MTNRLSAGLIAGALVLVIGPAARAQTPAAQAGQTTVDASRGGVIIASGVNSLTIGARAQFRWTMDDRERFDADKDGAGVGLEDGPFSQFDVPRMRVTLPFILAAGMLVSARAADAQTAAPAPSPSTFDRIWKFTELYSNDRNRIVQRVQLSGRFHEDYALVNSDQGDHDEWNVRRLRLGARATFFRRFTLHGEAEFNPQERDPLYLRLTDMNLQWSPSGRVAVTVGKQGVPFTSDGATSSRELVAIDRSSIGNNIWFPKEYMTGVSVSGRVAPWVYRVGVYSSGAENREFGEFTGGVFTLGLLGYDFGPSLGMKEALVTANYLYQQPDENNTLTRQLRHILSVHTRLEEGRVGLRADVSTATGYLGQSDLQGVMVMPFFSVTPKFQLVARYTLVTSDDPNGVRLATYENRVVSGRGDRYSEMYAGANYYLYAHRLKLQTGIQWGEMRDEAGDGGAYSGVAWTSGVRVGW